MAEANQFIEDIEEISSEQSPYSGIRIPIPNQNNLNRHCSYCSFVFSTPKVESPRFEQSSHESIKNSSAKTKKICKAQKPEEIEKKKEQRKKEKEIKIGIEKQREIERQREIDREKEREIKRNKEQTKKLKRFKDNSIQTKTGRPQNFDQQGSHLIKNKSYNDIVFHFSRFLIFLKIRQPERHINYSIPLRKNSKQEEWFTRMDKIMSQDNFPAYEAAKPDFLLHPNSPHYIFNHFLTDQQIKTNYSRQQVKLIILAFLSKKGLLSEQVYNYVNSYWRDIIYLVNHPYDGIEIENDPQEQQLYVQVQQKDIQVQEKEEENEQKKRKKKKKKDDKVDKKEKDKQNEHNMMKAQLQADDSIIAYQISCYLHACCQKFNINIQV